MARNQAAKKAPKNAPDLDLTITRTLDAPRDQVWKAWTDRDSAVAWWGPKGFTVPFLESDFQEGGKWRARMRSAEGEDFPQHGTFREIVEPERLSFTFNWDNEPGHENLVTVTLAERGKKTAMTFHQAPFESAEERDGHEGGWNESFDRLEEFLARE